MSDARTVAELVATTALAATIACASHKPTNEPQGRAGTEPPEFVQVVERKPRAPLELEHDVDEEAMSACTSAADCVVLEMGCCDHCNGGFLLSVHRLHAEQALATQRVTDCVGEICTDLPCPRLDEPICAEGECARVESEALGGVGTSVTVIRNAERD